MSKTSQTKRPVVSEKDLARMTPFGRRLAEGMIQAVEFARGDTRGVRVTHVEVPRPAPRYTPEQIAEVRRKAGLTQSVFARAMNVSTTSVENWERGVKTPGPASRRLIQMASDSAFLQEFAGIFGAKAPRRSTNSASRTE